MDDDIESHELPEGMVREAEHLGEVGTVVESGVCVRNVVLILVAVVEDNGGDSRNSGAHIKSIFEGGVPVLALVDTITVCLGELREGLACEDTHGELSHGVHGLGEALDEGLNLIRDSTSVVELSSKLLKLAAVGEFSSEEEPEGTFGDGL